ncbi:Transmembrane protein 81, partial [Acanthisitta chloris]
LSPILMLLLCVPAVLAVEGITMPTELQAAVANVVINTTSCSVTCGLGFKVEVLCEITSAGERRNCSSRRSSCLTQWVCGLQHLTTLVGQHIQLNCFTSDAVSFGNHTYGYTWRVARGLVTTNDVLFKPFSNPSPALSFSPVREADAGTYRCDVQVLEDFRLIKRIYFGLRVIPGDLVDLNFEKALTREQKLTAKGKEGGTGNGTQKEEEEKQHFQEKELFYEVVWGVGSGVILGVLVSLLL